MPLYKSDAPEAYAALVKMHRAADEFYEDAQAIGVHTFLEFTGFMREYIKMCEQNLEQGRDFTTCEISVQGHHAEYIAEKMECIFGDQLEVHFKPGGRRGRSLTRTRSPEAEPLAGTAPPREG